MAELQPTYGNYTLKGKVVWKNRQHAYKDDTSGNGNKFRVIDFGIKTEDKNIVNVKIFQTKFDEVQLQNKETKERDKRVKYGEHTGDLPEGYKLFMPVNIGLEQDEEGNNIKTQLIPYDAAKYINDNLDEGDTVFSFGSPQFRERKDREGNVYYDHEFEIRGIYGSSDDYDSDEFQGESTFEQKVVLKDVEKDGSKLWVNVYIVTDRKGNFVPQNKKFYIDIEKYKQLAKNVKALPFGTVLSTKGFIHHTVEEQEVEQQDSGWGEDPSGKNSITRVHKAFEITKVDKPNKEDKGVYSESDFVKKQSDVFTGGNEKTLDDIDNEVEDIEWGSDPSDSDKPSEDPFDVEDDDLDL